MPQILLTNDDGIRSQGLKALAAAVAPLGEVTTVAPARETSAIGHALTLHQPLRLEHIRDGRYAVDGTPTDCVNIAVAKVLKRLPALVISGINKGLNVGDDVTYSGTVAGALEAALLGVPSIAVSLQRTSGEYDFEEAANAAAALAARVLARGLPRGVFLNVNVPQAPPRGFRLTVQAKRNHVTTVAERHDPKGRAYFWIGEGRDEYEPDERSDHQAVRDAYISVTPLHADMTARQALAAVETLLA
jgi:5'-nucleotidase